MTQRDSLVTCTFITRSHSILELSSSATLAALNKPAGYYLAQRIACFQYKYGLIQH